MNVIKSRAHTTSPFNDERRQILPSQVTCDADFDRFEVFRNNPEDKLMHATCLIWNSRRHTNKGADYYIHLLDEFSSESQIKKDEH
jgi:hypothetical protein